MDSVVKTSSSMNTRVNPWCVIRCSAISPLLGDLALESKVLGDPVNLFTDGQHAVVRDKQVSPGAARRLDGNGHRGEVSAHDARVGGDWRWGDDLARAKAVPSVQRYGIVRGGGREEGERITTPVRRVPLASVQ